MNARVLNVEVQDMRLHRLYFESGRLKARCKEWYYSSLRFDQPSSRSKEQSFACPCSLTFKSLGFSAKANIQ